MANPDANNLPADLQSHGCPSRGTTVSLTGTGEHSVVPIASRALEPADVEGTQPSGAGISSPLSMASLLKAFRHRWMLAVSVGLALLAVFAAAAWYFLPAKYTAYALLRISESEPAPLIPDQRATAIQSERYFENTQVALIKSRPIILAALRQPGISELGIVRSHDDPAGWLEVNLKVAFLEKTDIVRISLDGAEPKELAALVNAVKSAYLEEEVNGQRKKKLALLEDLEKIYLNSEEKIRSQRAALRDLAQRLKSSDVQALSLQQKSIFEQYAALQRELTQLQAQIRSTEIAVAIHKANGGQSKVSIPESALNSAVESDPLIVQKKLELAQLHGKINEWALMTEPGHPTRERHEKDRQALEEALNQMRSRLRAALEKELQERVRGEQEFKDQDAREKLEMWRQSETQLKSHVERVLREAQSIGVTTFELELKKSEFEQAEAVVKRLREEKERLQVELQSSKQRIIVLHPAEVPTKKNLAAQARSVGFAGALGLFLGLFSISYWEARSHRIQSKEEVVNALGYRVIGELPWVHDLSQQRQGANNDPLALLTASVADLRALLLCEAEGQGAGRILMVTSAVPREGKTTLASHLAVSLAQAGRRTLLIDGDWRRPQLHHVFDLPRGPGLCEILRGATTADKAAQPGPVSGLTILVAGENSHAIDLAQLMDAMRSFLETARKEFDFILLDSPPVLPVADALLLGKRVDGVLFSVRPSVSQLPLVAAAFERLASLRIPVLGAVVNGVPFRRGSYKAYGYGYELADKTEPRP